MKIILCVDERAGYSFNKRRQSRDIKMREHMLGVLREEGAELLLNSYTERSMLKDAGLFTEQERAGREACPAKDGDGFLEIAKKKNCWAFVENEDISPYYGYIDEMIIYRWNRLYLSDLHLSDSFLSEFVCVERGSFKGSSHDEISFERLRRKEKAMQGAGDMAFGGAE